MKKWPREATKFVTILSVFLLLASCRTVAPPVPANVKPMDTEVARKLDQGLLALAHAARLKDTEAVVRTAKERNIPLENGSVRVELTVDKAENVAAMEKAITDVISEVIREWPGAICE